MDTINEPLCQIVPTLLEVPFSTDHVSPLGPAADEGRLAVTLQQDSSSKSVEDIHPATEDVPHGERQPFSDVLLDTDVSGVTMESVDELKSTEPVVPRSSTEPVESTSETLSVSDLTSEFHINTDVVIEDRLDSRETQQ